VNVTIDVPSDSLNSNKDRGNYHSAVNVLGIACKQDDTVGARFSDTRELDLTKTSLRWPLAATGWSSCSAPAASTSENLKHPFRLFRILGRQLLSAAWFYRLISRSSMDAMLVVKLRVQDLPPGAYRLVLPGVDSANYQAPQEEIEFTISN
jgi:hypothetical protein